ncbi:ATPase family AAA domain-containing protein 2-like [Strix aluco]|uniref:ATPase family AAA domain-containing protein 2-like n=1 Tax=Strix aluco TaxID=111821 RepID=UPI003DA60939
MEGRVFEAKFLNKLKRFLFPGVDTVCRRSRAAHKSDSASSSDDGGQLERCGKRSHMCVFWHVYPKVLSKYQQWGAAFRMCLPLNFGKDELKGIRKNQMNIGASLSDGAPVQTDCSVRCDGVGGLSDHIASLKGMVIFLLLYPEVFERLKVQPPRGCLFCGPPGTGKTLVARALAKECSQGDRRVAFFMRKGADCLSKWVGESERELRLLSDQAHQMRPSIIFFDEIDGLAPVRSSKQDQIYSSVVSTLLALMDGLVSRGEVAVIGATNRPDAVDPALRRPGRFDRELLFSLPNQEARPDTGQKATHRHGVRSPLLVLVASNRWTGGVLPDSHLQKIFLCPHRKEIFYTAVSFGAHNCSD